MPTFKNLKRFKLYSFPKNMPKIYIHNSPPVPHRVDTCDYVMLFFVTPSLIFPTIRRDPGQGGFGG
jgi:hypothetical protein